MVKSALCSRNPPQTVLQFAYTVTYMYVLSDDYFRTSNTVCNQNNVVDCV